MMKMSKMRYLALHTALALFAGLFVFGCGNGSTADDEGEETDSEAADETADETADPGTEGTDTSSTAADGTETADTVTTENETAADSVTSDTAAGNETAADSDTSDTGTADTETATGDDGTDTEPDDSETTAETEVQETEPETERGDTEIDETDSDTPTTPADTDPPAVGEERWRFASGSTFFASPAVGPDGTLYVGNYAGDFFAITPEGTEKWRHEFATSVTQSAVVGDDGTVYAIDWGEIIAFLPDGTEKWRATAPNVNGTPALGPDGSVVVPLAMGILALDTAGEEIWSYVERTNSSLAVGVDGTVYDKALLSLSSDGELLWSADLGMVTTAALAIGGDGTIYTTTYDGLVHAVTAAGDLSWEYDTGCVNSASGVSIGADNLIYTSSCTENGALVTLLPDGTESRRVPVARAYSVPTLAADGTVYVVGHDWSLHALDSDGEERWAVTVTERMTSINAPTSSPAIGPDGTVYFASTDGNLYAIVGTAPLAETPWPKVYADAGNSGRARP